MVIFILIGETRLFKLWVPILHFSYGYPYSFSPFYGYGGFYDSFYGGYPYYYGSYYPYYGGYYSGLYGGYGGLYGGYYLGVGSYFPIMDIPDYGRERNNYAYGRIERPSSLSSRWNNTAGPMSSSRRNPSLSSSGATSGSRRLSGGSQQPSASRHGE